MKVAVDSRMIKMSGIGTYIQNLMKNHCYDISLGVEKEIHEFNEKIEVIPYDSKIYGIKEQIKFPYTELRKKKPYILHIPHYNIPIFYRGKMVVTIHDITHLKLPEYLPNKFAYYYAKFMIGLALKKASKVFVVSNNTKKDILENFKIDEKKIKVIYNGVGSEFIKKNKTEIEYLYDKFNIPRNKKMLLYVGNLKPHKNLDGLLEAFSICNKSEDVRLLLVGKAFKNYNIINEKEKKLGIEKRVFHTGIVNQNELVDLYNLADLFVFPSLYEGFGLPVLEALKCGTPVICSNTSSMPEIGGDLVSYFNPLSIQEIADSIDKHLDDKFNVDYEKIQDWLKNFDWKKLSEDFKKEISLL